MLTENRRLERDPEIIDYLQANFDIYQIKDFSKGSMVEARGMVLTRLHRVALPVYRNEHQGAF